MVDCDLIKNLSPIRRVAREKPQTKCYGKKRIDRSNWSRSGTAIELRTVRTPRLKSVGMSNRRLRWRCNVWSSHREGSKGQREMRSMDRAFWSRARSRFLSPVRHCAICGGYLDGVFLSRCIIYRCLLFSRARLLEQPVPRRKWVECLTSLGVFLAAPASKVFGKFYWSNCNCVVSWFLHQPALVLAITLFPQVSQRAINVRAPSVDKPTVPSVAQTRKLKI